jgi:hypothetical protein
MDKDFEILQALVKAQHDKIVERLEEDSAECYQPALMVFVSIVTPVFVQGFFTFGEDEKIIESILIEYDEDGTMHPIDNWGL